MDSKAANPSLVKTLRNYHQLEKRLKILEKEKQGKLKNLDHKLTKHKNFVSLKIDK